MQARALLLSALTALTTLAACGGGGSAAPMPAAQLQKSADTAVSSGLAGVALQHLTATEATPALAGVRRMGAATPVQPGDAFMIGSTTKAMTAALAGRLVERGALAWTTTLAEALPDLATGMQPAYRTVTLEQLLNHQGGVPAFTDDADMARFQAALAGFDGDLPTTLAGRERFFAAWLLAQQPPSGVTPGRSFVYSNAGYALAALMLETRTGRSLAELFNQELAQPLGMPVSWTAADAALVNRPVGHEGAKGKLAPLAPLGADEAAWLDVLRASGQGLTLTPDSYAAWLRWHLSALRGESTPLAAGYLQRLKAMKPGDYAMGWISADIDGRPVLFHNGADLGFSSLVVVDAQGRSASFGLTNSWADDGVWVLAVLNQALLDIERALPPR